MKQIITLGLAAVILAGCAGGPQRLNSAETLERYKSYAGEPVNSFYAPRIDSWQPLSDDTLVLRTGINKAYLVKVWSTCRDLRFTEHIRVVSSLDHTVSRFDKVKVGRDTCPIQEIRPVDLKQMKTDADAIRRQKEAEAKQGH